MKIDRVIKALHCISEKFNFPIENANISSNLFCMIRLNTSTVFSFSFVQDTQEFLRCFMDQLHEELKHPVIPDVLDTEEEHECDDNTSITSHQGPQEDVREELGAVSPPMDVPGHSDTDYETCESGISSERSSVENSMSGDDLAECDNNKVQEQNKANASGVVLRSRKDKNRITPEDDKISRPDSGISSLHSDSSLNQRMGKEMKDCVNMAHQQMAHETQSAPELEHQTSEQDGMEYSDAVSELEPLQGQKVKVSSPSSAPRLRHLSECSNVSSGSPTTQAGASPPANSK